jgi:hypothetical protein
MVWVDLIGYLAAVLMFSTFYMKKMIPLRAIGISSNIVFITYTLCSYVFLQRGIWPLFILHATLLPLNIIRMRQMIKLVNAVRESSDGNFAVDYLTPFMEREYFRKGDYLFRKGEESLRMYYVQNGTLRLEELGITLEKGELIGEMGLFSSNRKRSATVVCDTDVELLSIPKSSVIQLYYQNPKFGFYLVRLVVDRLLEKRR